MIVRSRKLALVSLAAAYVAFLPQFYQIYKRSNRYAMGWNGEDGAALATALCLTAGLIFALGLLVVAVRGVKEVLKPLSAVFACLWSAFLFFIVFRTAISICVRSGTAQLITASFSSAWVKLLCYAVLPVVFYLLFPAKWPRIIEGACVLVSPAVAMLLVSLAFWSAGDPEIMVSDSVEQVGGGKQPDYFIFLFDGWSPERTFDPELKLVGDLPNLTRFLGEAVFYKDAYSPGTATARSVSRFLFQDETSEWAAYENLSGSAMEGFTADQDSIFEMLDENAGRYRMLSGNYLNYPVIFGDRLDYLHSEKLFVGSADIGYIGKLQLYLVSQIAWWRHIPGLGRAYEWLRRPLIKQYLHEKMFKVFVECAENHPDRGMIAFVHFLVPHAPYVWKNGARCPRFRPDLWDHTLENYKNNLMALDEMIGKLMDFLVQQGRYEDATIVLMSDHNWYDDPRYSYLRETGASRAVDGDKRNILKHVPLIIKFPHQKNEDVITNTVFTIDLVKLIKNHEVKAARGHNLCR